MSVHMQCNLVWKTTFLKYVIFQEFTKCTVIYTPLRMSEWLEHDGLGSNRKHGTATWKVEMHAQFACYKIIIGGGGEGTMI